MYKRLLKSLDFVANKMWIEFFSVVLLYLPHDKDVTIRIAALISLTILLSGTLEFLKTFKVKKDCGLYVNPKKMYCIK